MQFQPNEANRLQHLENINSTAHTEQIFLASDNNRPIEGIARVPIYAQAIISSASPVNFGKSQQCLRTGLMSVGLTVK